MIEPNCKGCSDVDSYGVCDKHNEDGGCPCTLCIIKSMCQGGCCDEYESWIGSWVYDEKL